MTTQTLPYEILLRFADGKLSGAHYVEISRYLDDAGELITEKIGNAQPIPTELSESILGSVNSGALARIAELEAEAATKAEELTAMQTSHAQALVAKDLEREEAVRAAVEAIVPPKPADITIRAWQAVAILRHMGLWDAVLEIVAELPDGPDKITIETAIEKNADFARHGKTILMLAPKLRLTDEQLDAMFAAGAALAV